MTVASTEIVWKGNDWAQEHREYILPGAIEALDIASVALRDFGLESAIPSIVKLRTEKRSGNNWARCLDNGKVELSIPDIVVHGRQMDSYVVSMASSLCHEAVHEKREQLHPGNNLLMIPRAADEGMAYGFERMMAARFMTTEQLKHEFRQIFDPLDERKEKRQRKAFVADAKKEHALVRSGKKKASDSNRYYKPWFEQLVKGSVPKGEKLGVLAVGRHLDAGVSPQELLEIPAEEIMDMVA